MFRVFFAANSLNKSCAMVAQLSGHLAQLGGSVAASPVQKRVIKKTFIGRPLLSKNGMEKLNKAR
jgi:hypothetical protein